MNSSFVSRTALQRLLIAILTSLLLAAMAATAYAGDDDEEEDEETRNDYSIPITVTGVRGLTFGNMYRGGIASVDYNSSSAAEFTITGRKNKKVRITVNQVNLKLGFLWLPISVGLNDCAYSTDNGVTWKVFSSGLLFHNTKFPGGSDKIQTIKVRVGGTVISTLFHTRGTYTGSVTVSATYR